MFLWLSLNFIAGAYTCFFLYVYSSTDSETPETGGMKNETPETGGMENEAYRGQLKGFEHQILLPA